MLARAEKVSRGRKTCKGKKREGKHAPVVLTVGYSTHPIEDFIGLLHAHGVTTVVDVRTIPRSRYNPQFNSETLAASLKKTGVGYVHLPRLGGLRRGHPASLNTGWRNMSFRGFADYMQNPEFERGLNELLKLSKQGRSALMCAEAVPWRCHRSLISDALLVRGIRVEHILSLTSRRPHTMTPFAKIHDYSITYPAENIGAAGSAAKHRGRGETREKAQPMPLA